MHAIIPCQEVNSLGTFFCDTLAFPQVGSCYLGGKGGAMKADK